MLNVRAWLESIGLPQYADDFEANDVDADVLPELNHELLQQIGVRSVGHRVKIITGLKSLGQTSPASDSTETASTPSSANVSPPPEAERRQLTVMFADLVGSTELSQNLDPEDLRNLNRAYQDAAKGAIETSGGFVARYMGDGVLAYFGYPQAHEDDAERAVRAGLTLTRTVKNLDTDVPLAVRVGIATGPVVVGDIVGVGASQESAVVGETPNLAARLQGEAEPNTVVISEATMALTSGLFEHQALGARTLKGFSQAASIYRVGEEIRGQSRFIARSGSHLSPFVGREEELEFLARRWRRAKDSHGQAVLVMGEPGIGKSRLLAQLLDLVSGEPHVVRSSQCSPYHENSTLYPLIATFERLLRFGELTEETTRLEALRHHIADLGQTESLGLLAHLLSIPTAGHFLDIERMAAAQRREYTLRALVDYVAQLDDQTPVLCVFEDVHWADPTTRELLGRLVDAVATRRVLLIATTRPGFSARWTDSAHVHLQNLSRLGLREGEQLARGLASTPGALPVDVIDAVLSRAEGNPLFIEELTRSILQLSESATPNHIIPTTIQDSLMARIDASATGKMVAQCASVIGRTFEPSLLEAIWDRPAEQLDDGLAALQQAGLIHAHGEAASRTFIFKHALVRDTAYDTLLRAKRQQLHGRIAEVLRDDFPDVAMTQPELVARHFTEADQVRDAIQHWLQAGRRALEGSANQEAVEHLRSGLALVEALPESAERFQLELSLLVALHGPVMVTEGWLSDETVGTYTRAEALCERLGEREQLQPILHGQWVQCIMRGDVPGAREMALRFMRAGPVSDDVTTLRGEVMLGWTALFHGELSEAGSHLVSALGRYDSALHKSLRFKFLHDPAVAGLAGQVSQQWLCGFPDRALASQSRCIEHARRLEHASSLAYSLTYGGVLPAAMMRKVDLADALASEAIALCEDEGFPMHLLLARIVRGWIVSVRGRPEEGARLITEGLSEYEGYECFATIFRGLLTETFLRGEDYGLARATVEQALEQVESTEERLWEAELHRLHAEVLLASNGPTEQVAQSFNHALRVSNAQGARSLELRAATGLARWWSGRGEVGQAQQLLLPIYESFTEGFDTPDLQAARAVLYKLD